MPAVTALGAVGFAQASFTRPSDTNAYTAGDVVSTTAGAIMTFSGVAKDGIGALQHAVILSSANVATKLDAELWLFRVAPAVTADNSPIAFTDAELAQLIGVIAFPVGDWKVGLATAGAGGNAICQSTGIGMPFDTRPGATTPVNDLYGVLVARNAYVPVSAEVFTISLVPLY